MVLPPRIPNDSVECGAKAKPSCRAEDCAIFGYGERDGIMLRMANHAYMSVWCKGFFSEERAIETV